MDPKGTIVFTTVGRPYYGFDLFSLHLPSSSSSSSYAPQEELRLTDGLSVNFNGQFVEEEEEEDQTTTTTTTPLVYVSERSGASRIYLNRPGFPTPELLPTPPQSLFHDRPFIKHGRLYFISAHQPPDLPFYSWSALYSSPLPPPHFPPPPRDDHPQIDRLTPFGCADYSPSISLSGHFIVVASYGSRPWSGEFHHLQTDIVIFPLFDPSNRTVVCHPGGWPTWSGDSTIYFHRQADDGWWSIFRVDLPDHFPVSGIVPPPRRITPPGLHSFTPAAMHHRRQIAVATRRRDSNFRHIEVFDVESEKFYPVTASINPNYHHYNPFVSPRSEFIGYHRFRGDSAPPDELLIPHIDPILSPIKPLRMLRLNGSFPSVSPSGDFIAFNHDFDSNSGLKIVRSDGSKRWTLFRDRTAFYNSWSPTENNVIYTSIGPIFQTVKATVQIARVSFDPCNLDDNFIDDIPVDIKLLTREDTGNNAFPSCSPDGKYLVFRSGRSGHKNLYIVDAINGEFKEEIRQLTEGPWIDTMPSWSPDGKLIAFSSNRSNPDNVEAFSIYLIRPDDTNLRCVHVAGPEGSTEVDRERINHVCFSPDGEWLLFTANLGGVTVEPVSLPNQFQPYGDLYVVRLDGSGLRRLTWNGYENGTPAWHRGGEQLDMAQLSLECNIVGDKLRGQFDEPLWIHCDF